MTEFRYVDEPRGLETVVAKLNGAPELFLDTEFESTREQTRLCLLQIGTSEQIFLVDALKISSLRPLRDAFAAATWILHAGTQDVPLILRAVGLSELPRIFDTQIGYALVSAEANVSLAYLKYKLIGKREGKAHQADDWTQRPLSPEQQLYAAKDVEELPQIVSVLKTRADAIDPSRFEAIFRASREALSPLPRTKTILSLEMFRNAWQLGPAEQAGLRFLIDWYNGLSLDEQEDAPESKVLFSMASRMPTTRDVLLQLRGVPRGFAQRHHKRILEGLASAAAAARTGDFVPIEPPPYASFDEFRTEAWLLSLRAEVCEKLQVSPDFVLPRNILRDLRAALPPAAARTTSEPPAPGPFGPALSGFRGELLGPTLAALCESSRGPL